MKLKKKLGMGVATAVLGLGLIGGGTFAYFSDTAQATGEFTAGELSLSAEPSVVIDVNNLKPGDTMIRSFELLNDGTLDISKVDISTSYVVDDVGGNNSEDFGKHIRVNFLENVDKTGFDPIFWDYDHNDVISYTTLYDLKNMTPDAVENLNKWWTIFKGEASGLEAGTSDEMLVSFEFVENGADQNEYQKDSLNLTWTFTGHQTEGEAK
ncbi:spore coat-associated protein [Oceanobacillus iheyensis HTE831]|uniref:Spore coat-associated protein n=1 Tax=Oceanobacillus iheyensis (strain DSM 14371 / CIP 107618 / JCM 11309 / KCTC 3954 / HTE831) TaxID=221109 RepID=Q8ENF4_OCEIH|nr:CalY family protein [Oceanobacillus iheyensis]BAC14485.1 spore coat-associated protein [Oceanobacillus iheyensis HTE831]